MGGPDKILEFADVRRQAGSGGGNPSRSLFSQGFPHPLGAPNSPARVGVECGLVNFLCSFWNMEERWEERVRMGLNLCEAAGWRGAHVPSLA